MGDASNSDRSLGGAPYSDSDLGGVHRIVTQVMTNKTPRAFDSSYVFRGFIRMSYVQISNISNISVAYNLAGTGKAFDNVLTFSFYMRNFHA